MNQKLFVGRTLPGSSWQSLQRSSRLASGICGGDSQEREETQMKRGNGKEKTEKEGKGKEGVESMGARRHCKWEHVSPLWKCCKVLFGLQMFKVSVDDSIYALF